VDALFHIPLKNEYLGLVKIYFEFAGKNENPSPHCPLR